MRESQSHIAELSLVLSTIKELTHSGVELWRDGDQVHYAAAEEALSARTLHWLRQNKTLIRSMLSHGDPARCSPGASVERNIVALGRGNLDHQVFCVHAIDGSASCYFDLARELTRNGIGTYGIHSLDLECKKGMPTTMAGIAREYGEQLIRVRPTGPIFLVGWCSGALIAFEIARELIRRGREVRRLVLLDPTLAHFDSEGRPLFQFQAIPRSVPPTGLPSRPSDGQGQHWWKFLSLISAPVATGGAYPLDPAFWDMDETAKCDYLFANRRNEQLINLSCMLNQAKSSEDVRYIFESVRNQAIALSQYQPAFLETSVSLFVSADTYSYSPAQIEARATARESMWTQLSAGFELFARVPGGHMALVARPCVDSVAEHIAAAIWPPT